MISIPAQIAKFRSLINGYKISQILMSLEKLGVFEVMGKGVTNISEIASRTGVGIPKLAPLLNAVVHYELLSKNGDEYAFTEDAVILNPTHPASDRKSTRLNSSHIPLSRMPSSA